MARPNLDERKLAAPRPPEQPTSRAASCVTHDHPQKMRLELALIVGILFFCSWCAYIVARMNASVGGPTQAAGSAPQSDWVNASTVAPPAGDYQFVVNRSQSELAASRQQQHQEQPSSLVTSYEPRARYQQQFQQHAAYNQPAWSPHQMDQQQQQQLPQAGPPYASAAAINGQAPIHYQGSGELRQPAPSQWQAYALPTGLAPKRQRAPQLFGPAPELMSGNVNNELGDYETAEAVEDAVQPQETTDQSGQESGAADEHEDEEPDSSDVQSGPEQQLGDDAEDGPDGSDDEAEMPPARSELKQLAQRRSYSEQDSSANERDKDGRLVVTKRRHLINGKPVKGRRQRVVQSAGLVASEGEPDAELTALSEPEQPDDFEQLVREIDQDDRVKRRTGRLAATGTEDQEQDDEASELQQQRDESRSASSTKPLRAPGSSSSVLRNSSPNEGQVSRRADDGQNSSGASAPRVSHAVSAPIFNNGLNKAPPVRGKAARKRNKDKDEQEKEKERKRGTKRAKLRAKEAGNLNEHSLKETLSQQQWDDDSSSRISEKPLECDRLESSKCRAGGEQELADEDIDGGDQSNQEQVSDVVDRDEEARRLESMAHQLLLDPKFAELTRRRRQASSDDSTDKTPEMITDSARNGTETGPDDESVAEQQPATGRGSGSYPLDRSAIQSYEQTAAQEHRGDASDFQAGAYRSAANYEPSDLGPARRTLDRSVEELDNDDVEADVDSDNDEDGDEADRDEQRKPKYSLSTSNPIAYKSERGAEAQSTRRAATDEAMRHSSNEGHESGKLASSVSAQLSGDPPDSSDSGQFEYRESDAAELAELQRHRSGHQEAQSNKATEQQRRVAVWLPHDRQQQQGPSGDVTKLTLQGTGQKHANWRNNSDRISEQLKGQHSNPIEQQEHPTVISGVSVGSGSSIGRAAAGAASEGETSAAPAWQSSAWPRLEVGTNSSGAYEPADEIVSGQEDMHVEILARPAPQASSPSIGPIPPALTNYSSPPPRQPGAGGQLAVQQYDLMTGHKPQLGKSFPRVSSPFASGSDKVAKKKKFKRFEKKRSKLADSKYKAARAYASKRKNKQKRGK